MVLAGVIVGFMFLYGMKRRQERTDLERADLEAKRDALIARLREGSDPALEREAADVLRKLDDRTLIIRVNTATPETLPADKVDPPRKLP